MALARDCTLRSVPLLPPHIGSRLAEWSLFPSGCGTAWDVFLRDVADVHILPLFWTVSLPLLPYGLRSVPSSFSPSRNMLSTRFVPAFADLLLVSSLIDRSSGVSLFPSLAPGLFSACRSFPSVGVLSVLEFLLTDEDTTFLLACLQLFHTPFVVPSLVRMERLCSAKSNVTSKVPPR